MDGGAELVSWSSFEDAVEKALLSGDEPDGSSGFLKGVAMPSSAWISRALQNELVYLKCMH